MMNPAATEEVVVDVAAGDTESVVGGVRLHRIPREGGNTLNGTFFATGATSAMQGNNLTQDLPDRGLPTPDAVDSNWNVNAGVGGPILRDRLWFFGAYQNRLGSMFAGGVFEDRNFNNPDAWAYDPDPESANHQYPVAKGWTAPAHMAGHAAAQARADVDGDGRCPQPAQRQYGNHPRSRKPENLARPASRGSRLDSAGYESPPDSGNRVPQQAGTAGCAPGRAEARHDWRRGTVDRVGLPCGRHGRLLGRKNPSAYGASRRTSSGPTRSRPVSRDRCGDCVSARSTSTHLSFRFERTACPTDSRSGRCRLTRGTRSHHDMGVFAQHQWTLQRVTLTYGGRLRLFPGLASPSSTSGLLCWRPHGTSRSLRPGG